MLEERRSLTMGNKARPQDHYYTAKPASKPRFGLIHTFLRGKRFEFMTASGVFSKGRVDLGSRLLVESMVLPEKGCVLDVGCGYGVVGIAAALVSPSLRLVLIDVNERAVWLARQNIERNRVSNAEAKHGYLYDPVADWRFDCVLSNPPVSAGLETVKTLIVQAPAHMTAGALFQMVVRSKIGGKRLLGVFEEAFGNVAVSARGSGYRVLTSEKQ